MAQNTQKIGWIGMGRMGYPMAERLLKAGYDVSIWNRTRAKAEPLAKIGGKVVDKLVRPRRRATSCSPSSSTGKDLEQVYFGKDGVHRPRRQDCRPCSSTARPSRSRSRPRSASG